MWVILRNYVAVSILASREKYLSKHMAASGTGLGLVSTDHLVSTMFCWESFMNEGRLSVGAEEHVPMQNTGGS